MRARLRLLLLPALLGAAIAAVALSSGASAAGNCVGPTCPKSSTPPVVKTMPATNVTASAATLSGTVNPNGSSATCYFEYGTTSSYGLRTDDQTISPTPTSATAPATVGATLSALASKQPFHYQLVCTNASGASDGGDVTFTTSDYGPSQIRLSGHTGFVSQTGMAGVFIGCYGDRNCAGSVQLTHNGVVIGSRSYFFEFANAGGIVHIPLSAGAMQTLKQQGQMSVSVSAKTTDGQALQGGDAGLALQFHLFR